MNCFLADGLTVSANWRTTRSRSASCLDASGADSTVDMRAANATHRGKNMIFMYMS